jgi:AraC-like DNA-binding protein
MKARFEKVITGSNSLLVCARSDPEFAFNWHYHPEFELTAILDSRGQRLVGNGIADYGPGDLVLLGPNLPHSWRSGPMRRFAKKNHRAVFVQFRQDFLGSEFFNSREMKPILQLLSRCGCGLAFGHTKLGQDAARRLAEFPSLTPARRVISLLDILLNLSLEVDATILSTEHVSPMCRIEDQRRIESICNHLNDRFDKEVDFAALSQKVGMDQASLCRFFKGATGRTLTAYLNELRVGAASQLLAETDLSILDICFKVGFGNYSNFNRQFKRIKGYGPRALRQHFL